MVDTHRKRLLARILLVLSAGEAVGLGVACGGATVDDGSSGSSGGYDRTRDDTGCRATRRRETKIQIATGTLCSGSAAAEADAAAADASADAGQCVSTCQELCATVALGILTGCELFPFDAGPDGGGNAQARCTMDVDVTYNCGRAFDGLLPPEAIETDAIGKLFARAAWMEAASITAFRRLARELENIGAPEELVDAARTSARDEIRHARAMRWLAERHGAKVPRVRRMPFVKRSLLEIAIENAREGCVGETYGAVLAAWQASHAYDREVRGTMKSIADDELRHAALAHAIHEWIVGRLNEDERALVVEARRDAIATLHEELRRPVERELVERAGMPEPEDALALVEILAA